MIDWVQVDALRVDLDEGFDELVEVFLDEVDTAIAGLRPESEPAQLAADLHFLKGAALNLGFTVFADLCSKGEIAAGRGERVDTTPVLATFAASRHAFVKGLAERRAA